MGIVICYFIQISNKFIWLGLGLFLILFLLSIIFNRTTNIYLFLLCFFVGLFITNQQMNRSALLNYVDENVKLECTIKEAIDVDETGSTYIAEVNKLDIEDKIIYPREKIILKVLGKNRLELGDRIEANTYLREPKENTNPKMFNYKLYLETENIFVLTTVKGETICEISKANLSFFDNLRARFIGRVENVFDKYLSKNNSAILKSIILGNYSYLDSDILVQYRELGIAHILAVSGLHIGIIAAFLISVFTYIGLDRKINYILTICTIWIYGFLIGYPSSVLRALIMFTVLYYSMMIFQRYDSINSLLFAAFIILGANPLALFSAGFQLSFLATFFILYLVPKLKTNFYYHRNKIIGTLCTILGAQLGILPILAYYFNTISIFGILANLIIIPLLSFSLVLGFILLIISYISHFASSMLAILLNAILNLANYLSSIIYDFPILTIKSCSPDILSIILYYFLIFFVANFKSFNINNSYFKRAILFYLVICVAFSCLWVFADKMMTIEFIDVGQGDCILLKNRNFNYMIDTGGSIIGDFDVGEKVVFPYLIKTGIFSLDGIFISHFHEDHCKGLLYLMKNIDIKKIYIGYEKMDNDLFCEIIECAQSEGIPIVMLKEGSRFFIDSNAYFEILSSKTMVGKNTENENELSLVTLLNYYGKKILFTGDIESQGEKYLCENYDFKVDILKVPHHGSKTSSNINFIDKFNPKHGIILVGKNSFGHPSDEVLDRYEENHTSIYRTDDLGMIKVVLRPNGYNIEGFKKEKLSFFGVLMKYGIYIDFTILYLILSYVILKKYSYLFRELKVLEY